MKRARKLGKRYIRTLSAALRAAMLRHRFRARVAAAVTRDNALLRELTKTN